jgi:hypothetical protein
MFFLEALTAQERAQFVAGLLEAVRRSLPEVEAVLQTSQEGSAVWLAAVGALYQQKAREHWLAEVLERLARLD